MRPLHRPAALLLAGLRAGLIAALIAACGGSAHTRITRHKVHPGVQVVDVYSSLPLSGPSAAAGHAIARGIQLALVQAGNRAGPFRVRLRSLNDAGPGGAATWSMSRTAANARSAATDPDAIAYIGEVDSSATQVSLPILNQASIPQISPWSPYVGLTQSVPSVTAAGEPETYYPAHTRTFLRLAPSDSVQVAAMLQALRGADCTRLAVVTSASGPAEDIELAGLLNVERARYGVRIVASTSLARITAAPRRYLLGLRAASANCLAYVGAGSSTAALILGAVHAEMPHAPLLASGRLCSAALGHPAFRALVSAGTGTALQCVVPSVPASLSATPAFLSAWEEMYGGRASPGLWGTYGYAAMQLTLKTIAALGSRGDDRGRVLHALISTRAHATVLGSYSFDPSGDSTVRAFALYELRSGAAPLLLRVLEPVPA